MLLVAGPSGAGKSTFIDQLMRRRLPPEIRAHIPRGADCWPHFEANDCLKECLSPKALLRNGLFGSGIVFHYDIVSIHRYGLHEYEKDPAAVLFTHDRSPVIVCLKPSRERLVTQFESRLARHLSNKSLGSLLWGRCVRHPIRRATAPLRRRPLPLTTAGVLYKNRDWLGHCYQRWDAFVRAIVRDRPGTKVLYVEPCEGHPGPTFRLISASSFCLN